MRYLIASCFLILAHMPCFAFTAADMRAISIQIKEIPADFTFKEPPQQQKPSWYDSVLFPWLKENAGRQFPLKDKNIKPPFKDLHELHSFNVKLEIVLENGKTAKCSSTRIHKNWLLSAAHCLDNIKDVQIQLENKYGKEISLPPAAIYLIEGREQRLAEKREFINKTFNSMGFMDEEQVNLATLQQMSIEDDFLLIRIDTAGIEEAFDNTLLPRLVRVDSGNIADKDLFIVSKYGEDTPKSYLRVLKHEFKKMGKSQVLHEDKTALVAEPSPIFSSMGDSGAGLLGKDGIYGILALNRHQTNETFFVPFNDKNLQLMKNAMGKDFESLTVTSI